MRVQVEPAEPRERILAAAYGLFTQRGIRDVGVNELIREAGIAKATFYHHFPSKDDLVRAFLARREEVFTVRYLVAESTRRGTTPEEQLLAMFDVLDEWFHRPDYEACSYIKVLFELGYGHPLGRASAEYLAKIRLSVQTLAEEAGFTDPADFAHSWTLLMKGAVVAAAESDPRAARRALPMARWLVDEHKAALPV
ncbi:TetR/AcrR family transcriptional regulator [Arthrobacter sp. TMN-37]